MRRKYRIGGGVRSLRSWGGGSILLVLPLGVVTLLLLGWAKATQPADQQGVSLMAIEATERPAQPRQNQLLREPEQSAQPAPSDLQVVLEDEVAVESQVDALPTVAPEIVAPEPVAAPAVMDVVQEQTFVQRPKAGKQFAGRPLRKVREMSMLVTAYSPDEQSCGIWADGVTASGYSVWTNGMKLVAADTRLLPFGTIVTVPGYNDGRPVQVLDRGGKIKGHRLDVLYPTHQRALKWGAQRLNVTVWEYAD